MSEPLWGSRAASPPQQGYSPPTSPPGATSPHRRQPAGSSAAGIPRCKVKALWDRGSCRTPSGISPGQSFSVWSPATSASSSSSLGMWSSRDLAQTCLSQRPLAAVVGVGAGWGGGGGGGVEFLQSSHPFLVLMGKVCGVGFRRLMACTLQS